MWKKEDEPTDRAAASREPSPAPERSPRAPSNGGTATIGRSISIRGDVTGDEDLLIQGRVDGSVDLQEHAVTVGPDGVVKASIVGRVVTVEGRVEGDLRADDQVVLRGSAWVAGDISAPRVVLEDGARFQGGVDMGEVEKPDKSRTSTSSTSGGTSNGRGRDSKDARTSSSPALSSSPESSDKGKKAPEATVKAGT